MREKILDVLEKNGRIDLKEMAIMLGYSEAEVANEIADMEKEHIICGYNAVINWDKTSEEKVTALIEVKVTPQRGLGFDSTLGIIIDYDKENNTNLLQTLKAYLWNNNSLLHASEQLFTHRNTVKYRIQRITELTGRNFDDAMTRLEFMNALICLEVR